MASVANLLLGPPDLMPPGGDWAVGSVAATVGAVWVAALPGFAGRVVVEKVEGPSTRAPGRAHRLADGGASFEGISAYWQTVVRGLFLLIVVVLQSRLALRRGAGTS